MNRAGKRASMRVWTSFLSLFAPRYSFIAVVSLMMGVLISQLMSSSRPSRPSSRLAGQLLDTRPFAGKAQGVIGALGVPTRGISPEQTRLLARNLALDLDAELRATRPRVVEWLIRYGKWRHGQRLGIDALIVPNDVPHRSRQQSFGIGTLAFQFQNFSSTTEARLRSFLATAMPVLVDLYGSPITSPPGGTRTVTIVLDEGLEALDGGVYDAATDTIRLPEFVPTRGFDWFNLLHQVLHAFRGPLLLSFPAWEEGMARAAAIIAAKRLRDQGITELANFDPKDPINGDPLWVLPLYDLLNQPPLGNPIFLCPSGFEPMAFWRVGMSAAAWLKVAAENPQCFRQFNATLLAQPDPLTVRGDTVALVELMRDIVPVVEGQPFRDWYRRQYVLDTGITIGPKLYTFAIPLNIGILLIINHYRTVQIATPSGPVVDEQPFTGVTAQLRYRNDQSDDLFAEEGNEVDITDGEGFIAPQFFNIGGPNLIFVDIFASNLAMTVPFPYMVRGEEPKENPIFGGVLGTFSGSVAIRFNDLADLSPTPVTRGVFAVQQGTDIGSLYRLRITHRQEGMAESTERRNGAFDFLCLIIRSRPSVVTLQTTLKAGIHLFAVPLFPLASDEAQALGIPQDQLLLAHWNPTRPGDFKYELYPRITTAMMPGVGYWLKVGQDVTLQVQGTPLPLGEFYQVPLAGGWNQVGNPYAKDLPVSEIQAALGTQPSVDLATAQQKQWLDATVWIWDPQQRRYQIAQTVPQWQGFWIRSLRPGVRLVFGGARRRTGIGAYRQIGGGQTDGSAGQRVSELTNRQVGNEQTSHVSAPPLIPRPSLLWSVQFSVAAEGMADTENRFGVVPSDATTMRLAKPPPVPDTIWTAFVGEGGEGLAHDFRPDSPTQRWRFLVINGTNTSLPIALSWDGLAFVPRSVRIWVTDMTTGESFSLRQRSRYTFTAQPGEKRQFLVSAFSRGGEPMVRIVSVQSLRGRGVMVHAVVTTPVSLQVQIRTLTGRLIRQFTLNALGRLSFVWDGRKDSGQPVPSGPYLLAVTGQDEEGRQQHDVRVVMLR